MKKDERTARFALRLTPAEKALFEQAAALANEAASDVVWCGAIIEARGIVARVEGAAPKAKRARTKR